MYIVGRVYLGASFRRPELFTTSRQPITVLVTVPQAVGKKDVPVLSPNNGEYSGRPLVITNETDL